MANLQLRALLRIHNSRNRDTEIGDGTPEICFSSASPSPLLPIHRAFEFPVQIFNYKNGVIGYIRVEQT